MAGFVEIEKGIATCEEFLKLMKRFKEFRVRFRCDNPEPFQDFFPIISKKQLRWFIRTEQSKVTYEIAYNSKVNKSSNDIVYIIKMKSTLPWITGDESVK